MNTLGLKRKLNTFGLGLLAGALQAARRVVSYVKQVIEISGNIRKINRSNIVRRKVEPISIIKAYFKSR